MKTGHGAGFAVESDQIVLDHSRIAMGRAEAFVSNYPTPELAERLQRSKVTEAGEAVSAPTDTYRSVSYEAFYTDDISPAKLPTAESVRTSLALAVRLADLNREINPV